LSLNRYGYSVDNSNLVFFLFVKLIAIYEEYYSDSTERNIQYDLKSSLSNTKITNSLNSNIIDLNTINNTNKSNSLNNSSISTSSASSTTTTTTTSSVQNFNGNNINANAEEFLINRNKINYCNKENTLFKNEVFVAQRDFSNINNSNNLNGGKF